MKFARKMAISLIVSAVLLALVVHLVGARATARAAWEVGLIEGFSPLLPDAHLYHTSSRTENNGLRPSKKNS